MLFETRVPQKIIFVFLNEKIHVEFVCWSFVHVRGATHVHF